MSATVLQVFEKEIPTIVFAINQLAEGRSNATGTATLAANAASTVVPAINCGLNSVVLLSPLTATAAAALTTTYVSAVRVGSFTLTHTNNPQVDRAYGFVCLG